MLVGWASDPWDGELVGVNDFGAAVVLDPRLRGVVVLAGKRQRVRAEPARESNRLPLIRGSKKPLVDGGPSLRRMCFRC